MDGPDPLRCQTTEHRSCRSRGSGIEIYCMIVAYVVLLYITSLTSSAV
jgi:hypothetical protein